MMRDRAGLGVDLELAHMRAVAEGESRRIVHRGFLQARAPGSPADSWQERRRRCATVAQMTRAGRCRRPRTSRRRTRRRRPRPPADGAAMRLPFSMILAAARSSAEPPTAIEREPKVPVPYGTWSVSPSMISILPSGTPSRERDDLGEGRGVALAVVVGAEHRLHAAVRLHADVRGLEEAGARAERGGEARRRDARGFHIARHADAAQRAVARRARPGAGRNPS